MTTSPSTLAQDYTDSQPRVFEITVTLLCCAAGKAVPVDQWRG